MSGRDWAGRMANVSMYMCISGSINAIAMQQKH